MKGFSAAEARQILKRARDLIDLDTFWQPNGNRGLAMFFSDAGEPDDFVAFALPYPVPGLLDFDSRFYLVPLVEMLDWNVNFRVLALSLNAVLLYACDRRRIEPRQLPADVPNSYAEFTAVVEVERPVQYRTKAARGAGGEQVSAVHARESHQDDHRDRVQEFVEQVARQFDRWLVGQPEPLVLAAVEEYHPFFAAVCRSQWLVPEGVFGSPDKWTPHELHERSVPCMLSWRNQRLADFNGRFTGRMDHGHASCDLDFIATAAKQGRIETLLIGKTDSYKPERAPSLNVAVAQTLMHAGELHATTRENVPGRAPAAATLRW